MFTRSVSPEQAPDVATYVEVEFEKGDAVAIDGVKMSPATLLTKLNKLGGDNGEQDVVGVPIYTGARGLK